MSRSDITLLDCTFRDGGYYTQWDFSPRLVERYLQAMQRAGVDVVEFGFRFLARNDFLGAHAYTSDAYIRRFEIPEGLQLGVMINAAEYHGEGVDTEALIRGQFAEAQDAPFTLVRIAAHFREITDCETMCKTLKQLGYQVGFNMMQTAGKDPRDISQAVAQIATWNAVDVLYFADSLGSMEPADVKETTELIAAHWSGPIGFHAHNNRGVATMNAMAAMRCGAQWIDGTVLGMGRGAGNAQTENLLCELAAKGEERFVPSELLPIVLEDFAQLQREYQWGPHVLYHIAALHEIHPTFVQELLSSSSYGTEHVISAVEHLRDGMSTSYSASSLETAALGETQAASGAVDATNALAGRQVLLIAPGPEAKKHREAIESYIRECSPYVISLNIHDGIGLEYVDAIAACHPTRILMDVERYRAVQKPVILPLSGQSEQVQAAFAGVEVYDYGVAEEADVFAPRANDCTIFKSLVAPYAMAYATAAGAERVLLAGFDGYAPGDSRTREINDFFMQYQEQDNVPALTAITKTVYDIPRASVYQPGL